jgi:hypothetical protein
MLISTITFFSFFFSQCANATDLGIFGQTQQDYSDAINHAKDAFLAQSGLQKLQDDTLNYMKHTATDEYSWTKQFGAVAGGSFYIYKHRKIEFNLGKGYSLSLYQYGSGLTLRF